MKSLCRTTVQAAATLLVAATIGGCSDPESGSTNTTTPPPPQVNAAFRWVDATDQLRSSDATFIRGYIESYAALSHTGIAAAVYPGFEKADRAQIDLRDQSQPRANNDETQYFKLLRLTPGDAGAVSAVVCDGVLPMELDYVRSGSAPPESQFGVSQRPTRDIFGDWYATWWGMPGDPPSPDHDACSKAFASNQGRDDEKLPPVPGWPA